MERKRTKGDRFNYNYKPYEDRKCDYRVTVIDPILTFEEVQDRAREAGLKEGFHGWVEAKKFILGLGYLNQEVIGKFIAYYKWAESQWPKNTETVKMFKQKGGEEVSVRLPRKMKKAIKNEGKKKR